MTRTSITHYIKDINDKIRYHTMGYVNDTLTITTGLLGGKPVTRVADSNENPQTIIHNLEVKGYRTIEGLNLSPTISIKELTNILIGILPTALLDSNDNLKPMLAKKFDSRKFCASIIQPKLNGVRAIIRLEHVVYNPGSIFEKVQEEVVIRSREGNRYHVFHVSNYFDTYKSIFFEDKNMAYDGELYIHGMPLNLIRKHIPIEINGTISKPEFIADITKVQFHCYDLSIPNVLQDERLNLLQLIYKDIPFKHITQFVDSIYVDAPDKAVECARQFVEQGYEGGIVRNLKVPYQFGRRVDTMCKIKFTNDAEFVILDIILKNSEYVNGKLRSHICFVLQNDLTSDTFESVPLGDEDQRVEYLINKDKYIGKPAIVKFFERSSYRIPIHSNVIAIRDYE